MAIAAVIPLLVVAAFLVSRLGVEPSQNEAEEARVLYCATVVERDSVEVPNPTQSDDEEVESSVPVTAGRLVLLTEKMVPLAPDAAKPALQRQEKAYRTLVSTRDVTGFRSDELVADLNEVHEINVRTCELHQVQFGAREFSYEGVPAVVQGSRVSLEMSNEGNEAHEMVVYRRKAGFDGDFAGILSRGADTEEAIMVASGYAAPGEQSNVVADLAGGDYVIVCTLRTDNEPHWQRGMIAEFSVE